MLFRAFVVVACLAGLTQPAHAFQLDPPIITPQGTVRTFDVSSFTETEDVDTTDSVRDQTDANGPWVLGANTSSVGAKGSTASGNGRYESNISAFKIRAEGDATAMASTGDPEGLSSQINAFALQIQFTVPSNATFALRGTFEASGTGAAGQFGQEGGRASVSLTVQGLGANGLPWIQMHQIDQSATEPYEFVAAQQVQANSPITLLLSASSTASNGEPGSAESAVDFEFELDFGDDDGDGLLNVWETDGIDINGDGTPEIDLPAMGADPQHKNLFVELDAHAGVPVDLDAVNLVETAFLEAPGSLVKNPNGQDGIILFFMVDEPDLPAMDFDCSLGFPPGFDPQKTDHFGTPDLRDHPQWEQLEEVYAYIFRYCIWAQGTYYIKIDEDTGNPTQSFFSGISELPGNDFIVAAGAVSSWYTSQYWRTRSLAGTLMHEFGHSLNLRHGGHENFNYKPNYLSTMNYAYQLPKRGVTVEGTFLATAWFLDYARTNPPPLNEKQLREDQGYQGPAGRTMIFNTMESGFAPELMLADANAPEIDWNLSGPPIETEPVQVDLNRFKGTTDFYSEPHVAFSDWDRIWYHLFGSPDFADGSHASSDDIEEFDFDDFEAINNLVVHDRRSGTDCPADLNGDGIVDQGDIQSFIALFLVQDLAVDFNGDGIVDLGDIQVFIANFLEGC